VSAFDAAEQAQAIDRSRRAKAQKIVDEVVRQSIVSLKQLTNEEWVVLCANAGAQARTAPSLDSREIVYEMLRQLGKE
jgi:hypothetical protein